VTDDFAHRLPLNQIRDGERIDLNADEDERKAVADRLELRGLDRLNAHATLERKGEIVRAVGRLKASLRQSCVVTDEPVDAHVDEAFDIHFIPEPRIDSPEEEVELVASDCDVDRRYACASARSLSAERRRDDGAQGSRRPERSRGWAVRRPCETETERQLNRAPSKAAAQYLPEPG
jgi:hypothetical protein